MGAEVLESLAATLPAWAAEAAAEGGTRYLTELTAKQAAGLAGGAAVVGAAGGTAANLAGYDDTPEWKKRRAGLSTSK